MNVFKSYDEMTDEERRTIVAATIANCTSADLSYPVTSPVAKAVQAVLRPKVKHYETEWRKPRQGERFFCQSGDVQSPSKFEARTEPNIVSFDGGLDKPRAVVVREWEE